MPKKLLPPLTDEQKKLVDQYRFLPLSFLTKFFKDRPSYGNTVRDELLSELFYYMTLAARTYIPEKGEPSTYFYRSFYTAVDRYFSRENRYKSRFLVSSFDSVAETFCSYISGEYNVKQILDKEFLASIIKSSHLTKRELRILKKYYYYQKTLREIGKEETNLRKIDHISHERVRQIVQESLVKIKDKLENTDYEFQDFYNKEFV